MSWEIPCPCRRSFPDPGRYRLHSPIPENSGPWSQARSPSRGQTFTAWRNVKCLIPGTGRVFRHGGMCKRSMGVGKHVPVLTAGLFILGNGFFWQEVIKQNGFFHSEGAWTLYRQIEALIKKKTKFSSCIGKFRVEQLQSHIWGRAS